jgi:hydroxyquinol 1,2-dioxygenase
LDEIVFRGNADRDGESEETAMSIDLTEETITAAVQQTFDGSTDERLREIFVPLVRHLHDFAREVRLTSDEWFTAMDFLERVGRICTPTRQEFVLLSDILGLSVLVDQINQRHGSSSATDSTLLGPFYVEGRPTLPNGADISGAVPGMPLFFTGTVLDTAGRPVPGVHVDTWHSDGDGFYDVQQADKLNGEPAMRALLTTEADGRFWFRSIVPRYYPVPTDGPCGEILRAANRSPMRPEHIHFWFHAEGYHPLVTMLFRQDDPYLEQDAVFGAKRSLVTEFVQHEAGEPAPDGTRPTEPFQTVEWTFTLVPDDQS